MPLTANIVESGLIPGCHNSQVVNQVKTIIEGSLLHGVGIGPLSKISAVEFFYLPYLLRKIVIQTAQRTKFSLSLWECYIRTEEKCGLLNFSTHGLAVVVKTNSSTLLFFFLLFALGKIVNLVLIFFSSSINFLIHTTRLYFSNFSCMFLNPNNFFQFKFQLF